MSDYKRVIVKLKDEDEAWRVVRVLDYTRWDPQRFQTPRQGERTPPNDYQWDDRTKSGTLLEVELLY